MPNKLAQEKSPYLLQHQDNPVDWEPWGEAAFARAKREDKPLLVSIGYATCHWCHVMAHESFEDAQVARLLNDHFVSIKVDREERPDVDHVYMTVCQALTGGGGWPLNVFLTPEGKPFYAGSYFPKTTAMGRPGFMEVLNYLAKLWRDERHRLLKAGNEITAAIQPRTGPAGGEPLGQAELDLAFRQMAGGYDARFGGFGRAPKFPTPHNLIFLLGHYARTGNQNALDMAEHTLDSMRRGGLFDQLGHGFHRYSVDQEWLAPHFEKMLYDQAGLALAYLAAHAVTGKEKYADTAREVFGYVLSRMTSPEGGFFSAEDADSEGEEGRFYVWDKAEVDALLSPQEARAFALCFDITDRGNFEGKNIPRVVATTGEVARELGIAQVDLERLVDSAREKLLAARRKRVPPLLDDKILTAWNGLMIAALARGAAGLGQPAYLRAAGRAADFILDKLWAPAAGLSRRYRHGHAAERGCLEDYAFLAWGLIELHQAGQDLKRLDQAIMVTEKMIELFWDRDDPGFFFTPAGGEALIMRDKDLYDGATPSGNSAAAQNLLRLARLTGNNAWEDMAGQMFAAFRPRVAEAPLAYTHLMQAVELALAPGEEAVALADGPGPDLDRLMARLKAGHHPQRVILSAASQSQKDQLARLAPFTSEMKLLEGKATVYLCKGFACQAPVNTLASLDKLLRG